MVERRRRRGRPTKNDDTVKSCRLGFRTTSSAREMVLEMCDWYGKNMSEVLTKIIYNQYMNEKLDRDSSSLAYSDSDDDDAYGEFYDDYYKDLDE